MKHAYSGEEVKKLVPVALAEGWYDARRSATKHEPNFYRRSGLKKTLWKIGNIAGKIIPLILFSMMGCHLAPDRIPAPAESGMFSVIIVPDTQYYTGEVNGGSREIIYRQLEWILETKDSLNTKAVLHLGDIVDQRFDLTEWAIADTAFSMLDSVDIPYALAIGNHDAFCATCESDNYNATFGVDRFQGRSWYAGHMGQNNDNSVILFDDNMAAIILENDPPVEIPEAIAWADSVAIAYTDRSVIVVAHNLLNQGHNLQNVQGVQIHTEMADNANVAVLVCGHYDEAVRDDLSPPVVMSNYQARPEGGQGWLRIMTFDPQNQLIHCSTYSPWLGQLEVDANSHFSINWTPAGPIASGIPPR